MRISIIIPSYNARDHLQQSLQYIEQQEIPPDLELEVVVSDDGSTDGTREVAQSFADKLNLIYTYRPRDERSCRARARNNGIDHSSGEVLVFLDSGMLIPPDFIRIVRDAYTPMTDKMLAHYMFGVFTDPEKVDMSILDNLSPETLASICQQMLSMPEWLDGRHGLFDWADDELDKLPAPWTMGYSGAFTVPAYLARKVGGFDVTFTGWGAEDNDFAVRLGNLGVRMMAERRAFALHIPYVSASWEEKRVTNFSNRTKLHRKQYRLDTELYRYYAGTYFNRVVARFDHLVLFNLFQYSTDALRFMRETVLQTGSRSLLIGVDHYAPAAHLPTTHMFAHNRSTCMLLSKLFPNRHVDYLLGCDTPYTDRFFDTVIVTDLYRLLNAKLRHEFLNEMKRISRKLVLVCTTKDPASGLGLDEEPWLKLERLTVELAANGLAVDRETSIGECIVLEASHVLP